MTEKEERRKEGRKESKKKEGKKIIKIEFFMFGFLELDKDWWNKWRRCSIRIAKVYSL